MDVLRSSAVLIVLYADILLPLPMADTYTYLVPDDMADLVTVGMRVVVPFGARRYYTGIVRDVHHRAPSAGYALKPIFVAPDETPVVRPAQLRFWDWMASYYLCTPGEVYNAAVPAGLRPDSETVVSLSDGYAEGAPLSPKAEAALDALATFPKPPTVAELERRARVRNLLPTLTALVAEGAVHVDAEVKAGITPRRETFVRLAADYPDEESLRPLFDTLRRAASQERLLLHFLDAARPFSPDGRQEVSRKELLATSGASAALLTALVRRGVLTLVERDVEPQPLFLDRVTRPARPLTSAQQSAYEAIGASFDTHPVCLLHGAPSSGKTEIFLHLILDTLRTGRQALYLLPEIALTTQMTERLADVLGPRLLVYHSGLTDRERAEVWRRLLRTESEPAVVVGVRSSLFLPFDRLGLIVVDEEHEPSYKQNDPAPRYHARNAALMLARMHGARALLGSATPSLETYYLARTGRYGLVTLTERYGAAPEPEIVLVDTKEMRRKRRMKYDALLSPQLREAIDGALAEGRQTILFRNRRGYAPVMECRSCGYVPRCAYCDVSLTYHRTQHRLVCHYCGRSQPLPTHCPECGGEEWRALGYGTERVEDEISALYPTVRVGRLDTDAVRTPRAYRRVLSDFEQGYTQLLVGTQMLTKGLDFGRVGVVGVLSADSLMSIPDFRAHERAFQLMMQVSGRAGRRDRRGTVVIQTTHPDHPLLQWVRTFDYVSMATALLAERRRFIYPPYCRLITIILRHRNEDTLRHAAETYAERLRPFFTDGLLGPYAPPVARVRSLYIRQILLKVPLTQPADDVRRLLLTIHRALLPDFAGLRIHYEVD